jgi:D-glycero-alpha-D-manno-heptose-7-phosphate kinase
MIISRTPLRMSFVGGGSDLPGHYRKYGGAVLSTTIRKYVYISINRKFDDGVRIAYSKTEEVDSVDEIEHELFRATFELLGIRGGVEVATIADIPSRGTGLGSSSAFTVGLINAISAYQGRYVSAHQMAAQSCQVAIDICGAPIGKQDQYASAFGGLNLIEFHPNDSVSVCPIVMPRQVQQELESRIITFYTGAERSASALLKVQSESVAADDQKQASLQRMVELAYQLRKDFQSGDISGFGAILDENWQLKRALAPGISNGQIDRWYDQAKAAGAEGGKILGAGAGGFLMFYAPVSAHAAIEAALAPLRRVRFGLEPAGSKVIFYDPQDEGEASPATPAPSSRAPRLAPLGGGR